MLDVLSSPAVSSKAFFFVVGVRLYLGGALSSVRLYLGGALSSVRLHLGGAPPGVFLRLLVVGARLHLGGARIDARIGARIATVYREAPLH